MKYQATIRMTKTELKSTNLRDAKSEADVLGGRLATWIVLKQFVDGDWEPIAVRMDKWHKSNTNRF